RLGHRGNPEHAVERHRVVLRQVALAEGVLVDHVLAGRGHGHDAGDVLGLAGLAERLVDLSRVRHGYPPLWLSLVAGDCDWRCGPAQDGTRDRYQFTVSAHEARAAGSRPGGPRMPAPLREMILLCPIPRY